MRTENDVSDASQKPVPDRRTRRGPRIGRPATGVPLVGGRRLRVRRAARRGRRRRPHVPRSRRTSGRRGRHHLLVRVQQGRAPRACGGQRARRRPGADRAPRNRRGPDRRGAGDGDRLLLRDGEPPVARCLLPAGQRHAAQRSRVLRPDGPRAHAARPDAQAAARRHRGDHGVRRGCRRRPRPGPAPGGAGRDRRPRGVRRGLPGADAQPGRRRVPVPHHIADEFAAHDDGEQFRAGLDLLLAGLRQQAGA